MLHPFRGEIEELEPSQFKIEDNLVTLRFREAGMKGCGGHVAGFQTVHLILHQGDQRGNDECQARQDRSRQLITE